MKYSTMSAATKDTRPIRSHHITSFSSILESIRCNTPKFLDSSQGFYGIFPKSGKDEIISERCKEIARTLRVRNWKGIRRVDLDLNNRHNLTDNGLASFAKVLNAKQLAQINQLNIILNQSTKITGKGLKILDVRYFRQTFDLKKLTINASQCAGVTDTVLESLGLALQRYQGRLRDLEFNFTYCKLLTDSGLDFLNASIGRYVLELKTYKIDLSWGVNKITGEGISGFVNRAKPFLQTIVLECSGRDKITDEDLSSLGTQFGQYARNIKQLSLNFSNCWRVTDQGFINMIAEMDKLFAHLEVCSLSFNHCCGISGESIEFLESEIKKRATHLQILKLDFKDCSKITNKKYDEIKDKLCFIPNFNLVS